MASESVTDATLEIADQRDEALQLAVRARRLLAELSERRAGHIPADMRDRLRDFLIETVEFAEVPLTDDELATTPRPARAPRHTPAGATSRAAASHRRRVAR